MKSSNFITEKKFPSYLTFFVTKRCNLTCRACFRTMQNEAIDHKIPLEVGGQLKRWKTMGLKSVALSGGEPLLYPNIKNLVRSLKQADLEVSLITNGDLLMTNSKILGLIDTLALTIISIRPEIHSYLRGGQSLYEIANLLKKFETSPRRLQVNTIVSRFNLGELEQIGEYIFTSFNIAAWCLIKFLDNFGTPSMKHKAELEISEADFLMATEKIKKKFPQKYIYCSLPSNSPVNLTYVEPNGIVISRKCSSNMYTNLGSILSQFESITQKIEELYSNQHRNIFTVGD
ncbi:MAG: radical SAM protein [Candidatus Parcubacteria bacterium]|nr:radical SAM protein [Candidatus Parcubacteria bacterium]